MVNLAPQLSIFTEKALLHVFTIHLFLLFQCLKKLDEFLYVCNICLSQVWKKLMFLVHDIPLRQSTRILEGE